MPKMEHFDALNGTHFFLYLLKLWADFYFFLDLSITLEDIASKNFPFEEHKCPVWAWSLGMVLPVLKGASNLVTEQISLI